MKCGNKFQKKTKGMERDASEWMEVFFYLKVYYTFMRIISIKLSLTKKFKKKI